MLDEIFRDAAGGDRAAYQWLRAWHAWAHDIDDWIDEAPESPTDRHNREMVDLCARLVLLCSASFYQRHVATLGPCIAVVAQEWRQSMEANGVLGEVLRVAGNRIVCTVALLTGGYPVMARVSEKLWPLVEACQLTKGGTA